MKKLPSLVVVAGILLALLIVVDAGSAQTPPARPPEIAVIDIDKVMAKHNGFKAQMADFKSRWERSRAQLSKEADELSKAVADMKGRWQPGTAQYRETEERLTRQKSDFELRVARQQSDFADEQRRMIFAAYQEVEQMVSAFASRYSLSAVIKASTEKPKGTRAEEIARVMGSPLMWSAPQLDITNLIIKDLEAKYPPDGNPAARTGQLPAMDR